jgi:hypothetical protein
LLVLDPEFCSSYPVSDPIRDVHILNNTADVIWVIKKFEKAEETKEEKWEDKER